MSKYCPNCGKETDESAAFCGNCGTNLNNNQQTTQQVNVNINNNYSVPTPVVPNRNIAVAIILSLVTCGIYGIYWFVVMTDESNKVSNDNSTSGLLAFVLTLITCGIYGIYWYYKMGQKMYQAGKMYNKEIADNSILYLILGLFGFGIISYALIQSDLNKFSSMN